MLVVFYQSAVAFARLLPGYFWSKSGYNNTNKETKRKVVEMQKIPNCEAVVVVNHEKGKVTILPIDQVHEWLKNNSWADEVPTDDSPISVMLFHLDGFNMSPSHVDWYIVDTITQGIGSLQRDPK